MEKYYTTSEKIDWLEVIEVHRKEELRDEFIFDTKYLQS